jgi:pimeloyl-ACP methyl ester carboxylesterase
MESRKRMVRASMKSARSADGTRIGFDLVGDGPPIIVVAGATQYRAIDQSTPQLAALLASHFTVCSYDRRGRGDSGDTLPYAVDREIEDLAAMIAEVGGSASLFGMSSGGALALEAAASGLEITRLAVYEPPFLVNDAGPRPPADHQHQLAMLAADGRPGDAIEYFITKVVGMPEDVIASVRAAPVWPGLERVAHTLAYDAAVMGDYSLPTDRLLSVPVPTLVINGGSSDPRLGRAARALWEFLPDVQHRVLEGQTHDVAPQALAPVLRDFFALPALAAG